MSDRERTKELLMLAVEACREFAIREEDETSPLAHRFYVEQPGGRFATGPTLTKALARLLTDLGVEVPT